MNQRDIRSLELSKILELLASETACEDAAGAARQLEPAQTLSEANALLLETDDAFRLIAKFGTPPFGGLRNVKGALNRAAAGGVLSMRELLDIAATLHVFRSVSAWREHCEGIVTSLDDRFRMIAPNRYLESKITESILSEDEMADSASPALAAIRRKKRAAGERVRQQLDKLIHSASYKKSLQEPIVTQRDGRFVVPVKAANRADVPGLVHDTSSTGATVFVEPMGVVEANNEIKVLESKEKEEIDRILAGLSAEAGGFCDSISLGYDTAVELNVVFAKANLAYRMKASLPALNEEGVIELEKARHPLLDPKTAVPVDISLGGEFDTLVITGPNTGGKTVALKTIGLLTLMAMCGLMVPAADGSRLSVFQTVLADIGDEQSIEQSLSTFSAHMTNIIRILGEAGQRSLVLLDELGAGTDPVEGAALAISILERLRGCGAHIAATTHYAELKAFALDTPGVENGSCEFDVSTLRPTYRLLIGVPGRSNAFAISERLGIELEIVSRARELVTAENRRFEDVVDALEQRRQEYEKIAEAASLEKRRAEEALRRAEESREKLRASAEAELDRAKRKAQDLLDSARRQSNELLAELEKMKKDMTGETAAALLQKARAEAKKGLRSLEDSANPVEAGSNDGYRLPRPLRAGDTVLLVDINKQGTVLREPDSSGSVTVQAGIIKTRVPLKNLRLLEGGKTGGSAKPRTVSGRLEKKTAARAATEFDMRGMNAEEGILELDRFIDSSVMMGIEQVTIIHGKGTGVLRTAVHQFLRKNPSVRSFRLGVYGEGESGVTIAELK